MSFGAIGSVLAVLVFIFMIGQVWFHLVEGALGGLKRLCGKKTGVWHPLPAEPDIKETEDV